MSDLATSPRILVVDDDPDTRLNVQDILQDLGYLVDVAPCGEDAIECAEQHDYEVALLDYMMPGMNGVELYKRLRNMQPKMVAIMVTAYAGSDGAQAAQDAGTWRVLRKPLDVSTLVPLLHKACQTPVVLVVDDDEAFCDNLWQTLRSHDYRVNLAYSESDGISKASNSDYDTAVIDLHLKDENGQKGDGRKVVQWIRRVRPDARVVIVTGYHEAAKEIDKINPSDQGGAICYKPVDMDRLLKLIDPKLSL